MIKVKKNQGIVDVWLGQYCNNNNELTKFKTIQAKASLNKLLEDTVLNATITEDYKVDIFRVDENFENNAFATWRDRLVDSHKKNSILENKNQYSFHCLYLYYKAII